MRPLVTPEEMAAADKATIDAGTPVEVLMDRAGRAVARAAIEMLGGRYGKRVVVVCGKGNNGGDGFVAARVLRSEGPGVHCLFVGDLADVEGAARHHLDLMDRRGVRVEPFRPERLADADVVIDALFGTGFKGTVEGDAADAINAINESGAAVVAVDIPSGVDGATGSVTGPAVVADITVTMGAEKLGTAVGQGAVNAGTVEIAPIGIGVRFGTTALVEATDIAAWMPVRVPDSHKRSRGAVAVLAGSDEMTGAAALMVRGAMRAGAGYVLVGCTRRVAEVVQEKCPEAIVYIVSDTDHLGPDALSAFAVGLDRATALAIGPGLGTGDDQRKLVERVLGELDVPVVVDADGLNVIAEDASVLKRAKKVVITPHPVELERLTMMTKEDIQQDRVGSARSAAQRLGCEVLSKGHRSVIARPDGSVFVNPTGGPGLATAGTGDVLTGAVGALLAAGSDNALVVATYIHGLAGELVGAGAVAWDVAEALPDAIELLR